MRPSRACLPEIAQACRPAQLAQSGSLAVECPNHLVERTDLPEDSALLARIVARDAGAVSELYDRYAGLLFNLILRVLRERADAEDVLQEVFVAVWTRAESYNVTLGAPVAWLVRIARNRAIDRLRSNAARGRLADASQVETPAAPPARPEDRHDVARALDVLPQEQRELVEQAYFMGLTHSELAARFGLPLGTVKTRVRSGLLALRAHFQDICVER
jgi:RNA polymerase sigma-70 factor, ECF subfamily